MVCSSFHIVTYRGSSLLARLLLASRLLRNTFLACTLARLFTAQPRIFQSRVASTSLAFALPPVMDFRWVPAAPAAASPLPETKCPLKFRWAGCAALLAFCCSLNGLFHSLLVQLRAQNGSKCERMLQNPMFSVGFHWRTHSKRSVKFASCEEREACQHYSLSTFPLTSVPRVFVQGQDRRFLLRFPPLISQQAKQKCT